MNKNKVRWIKRFKVWHKWPAIVISFLAVLFAVSGVFLNHRSLFSSLDVSRKIIPSGYTYNNWNLDVVKGSLVLSPDSVFIYGKAGVFLTDKIFSYFESYNQGFESGIDNRSITALKQTDKAGLVAGALNGLYQYQENIAWRKIELPVKNQRITDIQSKGDTLLILTRDYLLKTVKCENFQVVQLPTPANYKKETSWFKFLWNLHSGELFGMLGKLFVDLLALVVIILGITGLIHFLYPKLINKQKRSNSKYRLFKTTNLHWHNVLGYIFALFLVVNALSGMFLRPPLLIPIANTKMSVIPYTHLDSENPWQDKLRKISWNPFLKHYLISTSDGFYIADENLKDITVPNGMQPPVSVMGCNVLQQVDNDEYLVGSFSGLFSWNTVSGTIFDVGKSKPHAASASSGRPISDYMVSGLVYFDNSKIWYSDYNRGITRVTGNEKFLYMPKEISDAPISLWNLALEVHTGRIFESLLGPFYILYVPLSGICVLMVLVSGFFLWYWVYRKKDKKHSSPNI